MHSLAASVFDRVSGIVNGGNDEATISTAPVEDISSVEAGEDNACRTLLARTTSTGGGKHAGLHEVPANFRKTFRSIHSSISYWME